MSRAVLVILLALCINKSLADDVICNDAGSQVEINACSRDEFIKQDKAMNETFQLLVDKSDDDPVIIEKLSLAQKAWILFRDAELEEFFACSDDNPKTCWGSMYPMLYFNRKAYLTYERTKQLREILKNGRGESWAHFD